MTQRDPVPRTVGTHDGTFHADEVTACALLILYDLVDEDKIIRTRDPDKLDACEYVCDVGGIYDSDKKLFDHHQADYQGSLSSAGMILQYLHDRETINDQVYQFLNSSLISGVDAHDNGKVTHDPGVCTFSHMVANLVPFPHGQTPEVEDAAFHEALKMVMGHLDRLLRRNAYVEECGTTVLNKMKSDGECMIFEESMPWQESFFENDGEHHSALFVVMPTGEHWKLRGIPPSWNDRMSVRVPLPEEWAGLLDEDLKQVSGIPGAIFCHKQRFISVWETKEDALKALDYTLTKFKEKQ